MGTVIEELDEMYGDHDWESRVQRDLDMAKLQKASIVGPEDELFRS